MTEAMSRRDIEDVLTSIKRLVSQDAHGRPETQIDARPEKLVLTPSLRVTEPDAQTTVAPVATEDDSRAELAGSSAPLPATDTPPATEIAPDPSAPAGYSLIRRISQAGIIPATHPASPVDMPAASADADTFDAFSEEDSDKVMESLEDSALEATLARLEAVLSGKPVPPTDATDVPSQTPDLSAAAPGDGEQIIDEGMLYQLVAHIVRQELQGELGEKITRNIRKLVRQEVARELQLRRT
ncbi:MAG: hypothetical protein JJU07_13320 [Natronohydrobacter sp.]|nr:hypothetical protein [Natronohydrobacter sp.]